MHQLLQREATTILQQPNSERGMKFSTDFEKLFILWQFVIVYIITFIESRPIVRACPFALIYILTDFDLFVYSPEKKKLHSYFNNNTIDQSW